MTFTEQLKLLVKRRSHFMCCLCHTIGVEVHHILPETQGGPDTDDNAAPLCPTCHETYGANPEKRKFIREARDFWYDLCEKRYSSDDENMEHIKAMLNETATKDDLEQAVSVITSAMISSSTLSQDDQPPIDCAWNEDGLRGYIRWLYPDISHCGPEALKKLFLDLQTIGYSSIAELHKVVGDTRDGFRSFARQWRDRGHNLDIAQDEYPMRLFLALFDEEYCRSHYPNIEHEASSTRWRRPSKLMNS